MTALAGYFGEYSSKMQPIGDRETKQLREAAQRKVESDKFEGMQKDFQKYVRRRHCTHSLCSVCSKGDIVNDMQQEEDSKVALVFSSCAQENRIYTCTACKMPKTKSDFSTRRFNRQQKNIIVAAKVAKYALVATNTFLTSGSFRCIHCTMTTP